jgi:hypothetical protein
LDGPAALPAGTFSSAPAAARIKKAKFSLQRRYEMSSPRTSYPDLVSRAESLQRQAEAREAIRRRNEQLLQENEALRLSNRQLEDKLGHQGRMLRMLVGAGLFALAAIVGLLFAFFSGVQGMRR